MLRYSGNAVKQYAAGPQRSATMPDDTTYASLLFEQRDAVARITLNRPQAYNTLNREMADDLYAVALRCAHDERIRAVILTGAGSVFCAGGDLKDFHDQLDALPARLAALLDHFHGAVTHLSRMRAPIIAAVNGVAAGAGLSLACAADLVLAAESASFTMAYTRAGLTPDGSSTFFLPRVVGLHRALDLALTNRMLSAMEAESWGIVTRVVPDAALEDAAWALATKLASGATLALGGAKRLLRESFANTLETQLNLESDSITGMTRTADGREGITAFVEKRPPRFTGR
jgi:2-(1,2-epoxy-1,2-dihydrophenyl)acetyl-CoA isomerase